MSFSEGQGLTHICRACSPGFAQAAAASTACEPCGLGHYQKAALLSRWFSFSCLGYGLVPRRLKVDEDLLLQKILSRGGEKENQGCLGVWVYLYNFISYRVWIWFAIYRPESACLLFWGLWSFFLSTLLYRLLSGYLWSEWLQDLSYRKDNLGPGCWVLCWMRL